ncbi:MAG: lipoprotein [Alphaproteobacteria bacterium]|nr:lipoprotein [Alphaproteobacteria bacterium]
MRKPILALLAALTLAGCGGPVLGTTDLSKSAPGKFSTPLTYGLPVAYFPITIKRDASCNLTASLDKPVFARDPNWNLRLDYFHHGYTNDTLTFQTDDVGLLTAINTTSENQTLAAIDQAFAVAAQAGKLFALAAPKTGKSCTAFNITYVFNPLEASQRAALNALLDANDGDDKVAVGDVTLAGTAENYAGDACAAGGCTLPLPDYCLAADKTTNQCVYFRRMRSFVLPVLDKDSNTHVDLTFQAPDAAIYAIPMRRADFVKFDVKLTFDHGVLTGYTSSDPSQVLAVLQIPSDLIKDIVGLNSSSSATK